MDSLREAEIHRLEFYIHHIQVVFNAKDYSV